MSRRAGNAGWVCPKCGRRFARTNQGHVCEIWSVDDLLHDVPPASIALYQRFVELVSACGPFEYSVTKANIGFRGSRRLFAGVLPTAARLHGFLDLMQPVDDPRFHFVSPYTNRLYVHHFRVTSAAQLDEEFARWVGEAYAVGQGLHLPFPRQSAVFLPTGAENGLLRGGKAPRTPPHEVWETCHNAEQTNAP